MVLGVRESRAIRGCICIVDGGNWYIQYARRAVFCV